MWRRLSWSALWREPESHGSLYETACLVSLCSFIAEKQAALLQVLSFRVANCTLLDYSALAPSADILRPLSG